MAHFLMIAAAIYAIIGGPSAGKTSIIEELKADGETTINEAATTIIKENLANNITEPWLNDSFQYNIFTLQVKLEKEALKDKTDHIFVDRGLLDSLVYLEINGKKESKEYTQIQNLLNTLNIKNRYAAIFFIEPHSAENFCLEKSALRRENTEEALELSEKIKAAYSKYYTLITIPGEMTPKERASLIQQKIQEVNIKT